MKLSFVATLALAATAVAGGGGGGKKLQVNEPCKKDGSMGTCVTNYCEQPKDKDQGTCQKQN